jgi:hypothetical protein
MGFQDRAWRAAADEYGRARAEKYGRIAKAGRALAGLAMVVLVFGAWLAGHGLLGG